MNEDFQKILKAVSLITGIPETQIKSRTRRREVKDARFLFMYYTKTNTNYIYKQIGWYFGRHHATVINSVKKFMDLSKNEPVLMNQYLRLCKIMKEENFKNEYSPEIKHSWEVFKETENQL
jgi:chromosomal replication initiation ATPase DnaA